jgi:ABC-2 type transport system permease protein
LLSVARKEMLHILRDPTTLFFALLVPILQLFMFGYAIDMNVRHIRTVVLDQAGTQESRALLRQFENSQDFDIVASVRSDEELSRTIIAGTARVGIKIPADYSRRLEAGRTAEILVLVDGSESSVAAEAVNVGNAIALRESLELALGGKPLPVEARPRVLFNPDTKSANFIIPGLMVIVCQMMAVMLSATAIVREKENGTFEQLLMTPVRPAELLLGKMVPYAVLSGGEFGFIAVLMQVLFGVPIRGEFLTLFALAVPFILTMLGLGLLVSSRVASRDAAMQLTMGTMMPSIFLSGYIFPADSMPLLFQWVSKMIPATWMIDAARGVILRGGGWAELWVHAVVLWGMAIGLLTAGALRFQKQAA